MKLHKKKNWLKIRNRIKSDLAIISLNWQIITILHSFFYLFFLIYFKTIGFFQIQIINKKDCLLKCCEKMKSHFSAPIILFEIKKI